MNKAILIFFMFIKLEASAQGKTPEAFYTEANRYMKGINRPINFERALDLFQKSAFLGNTKAMLALGNLYSDFYRIGDSAFYWYNAAIDAGNSEACVKLGKMYKSGILLPQNFFQAVKYFDKGVVLGNKEAKNLLSYMYYKGLGVNQNYNKAFIFYQELANEGDVNAMYFLGLCYRNGYGTLPQKELSDVWLQKAADNKYSPAYHELMEEKFPENFSVVSQKLQKEAGQLNNYQEKYFASNSNNYEGVYKGYIIYYDWSGKYVSEIQSLQFLIQKSIYGYSAEWKEGNNNATYIELQISNNNFLFSPKSNYIRINHYSNRKPETWNFNNAKLNLTFLNDSIQLSGFVKFYSPNRSEPGKPVQIILKKEVELNDFTSIGNFIIMPNPAEAQTALQFTSKSNSRIGFRVLDNSGKVIYIQNEKLLQSGTYKYNLIVNNFASGIYIIQLTSNGKIVQTRQLVKQ